MTLAISSCAFHTSKWVVGPDELGCRHLDYYIPINCYRFDYSSMDQFKNSMTYHAYRFELGNPSNALSQLTANKDISIESRKDADAHIKAYPEDIYILGRYIIENLKPREWLYIGEQAFLRSWVNVSR